MRPSLDTTGLVLFVSSILSLGIPVGKYEMVHDD
jgi:hypothetical protein